MKSSYLLFMLFITSHQIDAMDTQISVVRAIILKLSEYYTKLYPDLFVQLAQQSHKSLFMESLEYSKQFVVTLAKYGYHHKNILIGGSVLSLGIFFIRHYYCITQYDILQLKQEAQNYTQQQTIAFDKKIKKYSKKRIRALQAAAHYSHKKLLALQNSITHVETEITTIPNALEQLLKKLTTVELQEHTQLLEQHQLDYERFMDQAQVETETILHEDTNLLATRIGALGQTVSVIEDDSSEAFQQLTREFSKLEQAIDCLPTYNHINQLIVSQEQALGINCKMN